MSSRSPVLDQTSLDQTRLDHTRFITHASSESLEQWNHRGRPRNRGADQDHETGIERSGVRDQRSDRDRREGADNVSDAVEDADPGCDGARRSPPS